MARSIRCVTLLWSYFKVWISPSSQVTSKSAPFSQKRVSFTVFIVATEKAREVWEKNSQIFQLKEQEVAPKLGDPLAQLLAFMANLKPSSTNLLDDEASSDHEYEVEGEHGIHGRCSNKDEMLTLELAKMVTGRRLKTVKYTDFVFGHELGAGSFAKVIYAKRINKKRVASRWREFAVKTMSKEIIAANEYMCITICSPFYGVIFPSLCGSYHANVQREILVLNTLRHPNVTRSPIPPFSF